MSRFVLIFFALALTVAAFAAPPTTTGDLEKANRAFGEKSYKLALEQYEQVLAKDGITSETEREAHYMAGRCKWQLNDYQGASGLWRKIIADRNDDVWAGRAHWRLDPLLSERGGYWSDTPTTPLLDMRAADAILSRLRSDDLAEFYKAVVTNAPYRGIQSRDDRVYVYGFFDKLTPLLDKTDDVALFQLRKAQLAGFVDAKPRIKEVIKALRQVVAEFPDTSAAPIAQLAIGSTYMGRAQYVQALKEYETLLNRWPKSKEAVDATKAIETIKAPGVQFALPGPYLPGDKIQFIMTGRNVENVKLSAIPFDPAALLHQQKEQRYNLDEVKGAGSYTQEVHFAPRSDYRPTTVSVELDFHETGAYVLRADPVGTASQALLLISDLALVGNPGPGGYHVWAVHAGTGEPVPGAHIAVASDLRNESSGTNHPRALFQKYSVLTAGADGLAEKPLSPGEASPLAIVGSDGKNYAILSTSYWYPWDGQQRQQPFAYVYTDRPVYRPQQTVYWRAILRDRKDGKYDTTPGRKVDVIIYDPRGSEALRQRDVAANEFGSIAGEYKLPDKAPLGQYRVQITAPNVYYQAGEFRVEEYKKPEFEVKVTASDKLYKIGTPAHASVDAKYYFGAPVSDAEVKYTVRRRQHWFPWVSPAFGTGTDLGWFDRPQEDPGNSRHGSQGDIVAEGTGHTTAEGKFIIDFKTDIPKDFQQPDYRWWWQPRARAFDFQIEVTVTDKSRRNIDGSDTIVVSDKALQLTAHPQASLYSPGDLVKVELRSVNFSEEPVPTSGTLYIEQVKWDSIAQKEDVTTVSTQRVEIGSSGTLIASWRAPQDLSGYMRVVFGADDPFGEKSYAYANFSLADKNSKDIFYKYQGVQVITDKDLYLVGDTARVLVLSEFRNASAWYWINAGSGFIEKKVIKLSERTNFLEVPITEAFVPNAMFNFVVVQKNQVYSEQKEILVPPTRKVLTVKVVPDKAVYKPGEVGSVSIEATDYLGKPVKGEFSLSMFDKSIAYIAADVREDIRRAFYGERRALSTQLTNSAIVPGQYNSGGGMLMFDFNGNLGLDGDADIIVGDRTSIGGSGGFYDFRATRMVAKAMPAAAPMPGSGARSFGMADVPAEEKQKLAFDKKDAAKYELMDRLEEKPLVEARVRTDFRDSMFWSPTIVTDEQGRGTVKVKFPDSLTTWKATAVGLTPDTLVGNNSTETLVQKNLLIRLEAPRFFRQRDQVMLSGIVHNYLDSEKQVHVSIDVKGLVLSGDSATTDSGTSSVVVSVGPNQERRVDWFCDAKQWGEASIQMKALTDEESDAAEMKFPVLPHGIDKFVAWNGSSNDVGTTGLTITRSGDDVTMVQEIQIPKERIVGTTKLTVTVNPSLAMAIRDAIPYLIDYPYGCVEQTMSRFMPAAIVQRAFTDLNIPHDAETDSKLQDVLKQGTERLYSFQHGDGGWGWWRDDNTDGYMSCYVMYGFTLARQAGVSVDDSVFNRGMDYLRRSVANYKADEQWNPYWRHNNFETLNYGLFVLALNGSADAKKLDYVWTHRDELTPQGLAMLAQTLKRAGRIDDAQVALRNLYNFATVAKENQTAHWGQTERAWYWWEDGVESTSRGLLAYLDVDPSNDITNQAMKWLVINRKGKQWKATKDTSLAILALTAYMKDRKEQVADMKIEVKVGDLPARTLNVDADNFWKFDGQIVYEGDAVPEGKYPVTIRKTGKGTMFFSVYADYFTLEEGIKKAGNEIFVERVYERVLRDKVKSTTGVVATERYMPIADGETVKSGDELRVTLKIKSLNNFEYLMFEDPKPAGMEPVAVQSGGTWADGLCANMELRDQYLAFFIRYLPQGDSLIRYNCRAEIPGTFHTMPTTGSAMYYPPLRANSDELVIKVAE